MSMIMLFFPVTSACYDGLQRVQSQWMDYAKVLGANKWRTLWRIQLPAAAPAFATGLRVAVAIAPIGAAIGEWVGSNRGLGYLMLNANARMQIDMMFAAMFLLITLALGLFLIVDRTLKRVVTW